ncbi:MAG: hypothetical protein U0793_13730 [Gemmataceae bacterium]
MQLGTRWTLALAALVSLAAASEARALAIAIRPSPTRAANADAIVVGRVVALEAKDAEIALPGGAKQTFRIAVVNVTENIVGAKGVKSVRVGFNPPPMGADGPVPMVRPPIRIRPGFGPVNLEVGQDGLFFLKKHAKEDFFVVSAPFDIVLRTAPDFDKELADAKTNAKILENPMAALKDGNATERLTAASLLLTKYRQVPFASGKTEAIAADESKLILKAILDGNWMPAPGPFNPVNSLNLFFQLGVTDKDGFKITPGTNVQQAAKEWLEKNWETYRVQRLIPGDPAVGPRPIGGPAILPVPLPAPGGVVPAPGVRILPAPGGVLPAPAVPAPPARVLPAPGVILPVPEAQPIPLDPTK